MKSLLITLVLSWLALLVFLLIQYRRTPRCHCLRCDAVLDADATQCPCCGAPIK